MKGEVWLPIKGYEGIYEVSNEGNVRSVDRYTITKDGRTRFYKGRLLKEVSKIYPCVILYNNGVSETCYVHNLVAETFIPNPNNYPCVNHKSEVKTQNNVENLEWCTYKYNSNYGTRNMRVSILRGTPVLHIQGDKTTKYLSAREAAIETGIPKRTITYRCKNNINGWKYEQA